MRLRRSLFIIAGTILIAAIGAAIVFRIWRAQRRETPLPADWIAATFVLAGDGRDGTRDGPPARARLSEPFGVAAAADGAIYVTDGGQSQSVRRISPDGAVSTLARGFNWPSGLAIDPLGVLYVADTGNDAVRTITPDGVVSTLAGGFNGPLGVAADRAGRVIVADTYNDRVRVIETDGAVRDAADERFDTPGGVAVDASGNIFVAETGAGAVRMISPSGVVSIVEPAPPDGWFRPIGIAVTADGTLYVTDERGRIVEIQPGARVRTLVGQTAGFADGGGTHARLRAPTGVAVIGTGQLVVTEPRNAVVRLVASPSRMALRPPAPPGVAPEFDAERFASQPLLWPLGPLVEPFEITGTLGEPRGGDGERFHAGLDVHATRGTAVRAVRTDTVRDPISTSGFGSLNEAVRIGSITYVHLEVGRLPGDALLDSTRFVPSYGEDGRLAGIRVKRGARFRAGEPIGSVNAFNHLHVNVGWPGEEQNPLRFRLVNFVDTVRPVIARRGIRLLRETGEPIETRKRGRLIVEGRVRIVVDAWDQVDGNRARRRLGLYRLGYQVLHPDGRAVAGFEAPRETMIFDRLRPDAEAPHVVYEGGSGIPFYGTRRTRFLYVVTNTFRNGVASRGFWDADALPPGDYVLRVLAADINGNEAVGNRDVPITIPPR